MTTAQEAVANDIISFCQTVSSFFIIFVGLLLISRKQYFYSADKLQLRSQYYLR